MPLSIPKIADDLFIRTWNDSETAIEASFRLGIKALEASIRASKLRRKERKLKYMPGGRKRGSFDSYVRWKPKATERPAEDPDGDPRMVGIGHLPQARTVRGNTIEDRHQ